jgi:hypothetical protein
MTCAICHDTRWMHDDGWCNQLVNLILEHLQNEKEAS